MDLVELALKVLPGGTPEAMLVGGVVLGAGLALRFFGVAPFAARPIEKPAAADDRLKSIDGQIGSLQERLGRVEADVKGKADRSEIYPLKEAFARFDEKFAGIERNSDTAAAGVVRLQEWMLRVSERMADRKGAA